MQGNKSAPTSPVARRSGTSPASSSTAATRNQIGGRRGRGQPHVGQPVVRPPLAAKRRDPAEDNNVQGNLIGTDPPVRRRSPMATPAYGTHSKNTIGGTDKSRQRDLRQRADGVRTPPTPTTTRCRENWIGTDEAVLGPRKRRERRRNRQWRPEPRRCVAVPAGERHRPQRRRRRHRRRSDVGNAIRAQLAP